MDIDLRRKIDTEANLLSNLASGKLGLASDTNNMIFVEGSDKGTVVPDKVGSTYRDRTFGEVTAQATTTGALTSVGAIDIGNDGNNKLVIQDTFCYLMANGEKIIDYLHSNGTLDLNAGSADVDIDIYGTDSTTPILHCDAGSKSLGVNTITPRGGLDVNIIPGGAAAIIYLGRPENNVSKLERLVFSQYGSTAEPEGYIALRGASSDANTNIVSLGGGSSLFNAATQVDFYTGATSSTATGTQRMVIDSSGNVGIASPSPAEKLDVTGDVKISTDLHLSATSDIYLGAEATDGTWRIERSGDNLVFQRRESGTYVTKSTITAV